MFGRTPPSRRLPRTLALAAACAIAGALHADVPPPEQVPVTSEIAATGLPTPTPAFIPALNDEVCVLLSRGDSSSSLPASPLPVVARWWQRDPSGGWIWRGALDIPGWPTLEPIAPSASVGTLGNGEGGVGTLLAVPVNATRLAVARYDQGRWASLGTIDAPAGETFAGVRIVDGQLTGRTAQKRFWAARRSNNGTWSMVSATDAELGFPTFSTSYFVTATANRILFAYIPQNNTELPGQFGWRHIWIEIGETGMRLGPSQPPLSSTQILILRLSAVGEAAVATITTFDPLTTADGPRMLVFGQIGPDGVLVPTQREPYSGTGTPPVVTNALAQGRVLGNGRTWSRDADGRWLPGAFVTTGGIVSGTDVVAGGASMRTTAGVFDCDGDGIDDAIAIAHGWATDCDANGHPDDCDIALGMVADADHDGVPDHCAADCDHDGLSDLGALRLGARESCAHDGTLASCQIAAGEPDRDGNGIPDICDADRNGNGVPDVIEIAEGNAIDCDGDGRIDDVPVASSGYPMEHGGLGWGFTVPATSQVPGLWTMSAFQTSEVGASIDGFRFPIMVGTSPTMTIDGRPLIAFVAVDPTNDFDPRDAQVIWWQSTTFAPDRTHVQWSDGSIQTQAPIVWQYIATPHLRIDTPAMWIGYCYPTNTLRNESNLPNMCALAVGNNQVPHGIGAPNRAWSLMFTDAGPTDPATMLASPSLARAPMIPTIQLYSHGCPMIGDVDGNGTVDGADLGRLLGDWGPAYGSPCDLNHDNSVDGADLAILIAHFGD